MNNKGNSANNSSKGVTQNLTRAKHKMKSPKKINKPAPIKLKKVFKMVNGKLPTNIIEPSIKVFGKLNFEEHFLNAIRVVKQLKYSYAICTNYAILVRIKLLMYVVLFKLFENKFFGQTKISKFVGRSQIIKKRRRKKWLRSFKTKVPYYYLNSSRRSTLPKTYTKLKLYKLF